MYVCACVHVCVCQALTHTHQVKSVVWWATREPCGPIPLRWLALHGGMGNFDWSCATSVSVSASVCIHLCMCVCGGGIGVGVGVHIYVSSCLLCIYGNVCTFMGNGVLVRVCTYCRVCCCIGVFVSLGADNSLDVSVWGYVALSMGAGKCLCCVSERRCM